MEYARKYAVAIKHAMKYADLPIISNSFEMVSRS